MRRFRDTRSVGGFTLIEMLVVIVVIGVLVVLSLPALRGARNRGQESVSLAHARTNAMLIAGHAQDREGRVPLAPISDRLIGEDMPGVVVQFPDGSLVAFGWFMHSIHWNTYIASLGEEQTGSFFSPSGSIGPRPTLQASDYVLTHAVMATPEFWRTGAPQTNEQLRAMNLAAVSHPAAKGFVWEVGRTVSQRLGREISPDNPRPIVFFDQHGLVRPLTGATEPAVNSYFPGGLAAPLLTTADGVRGYDFGS